MSTLCFVLVLFTTQIINTKEVSSVDQNQTASTSTVGRPAPNDVFSRIDFGKVELFKDDDELPSDLEDVKRASSQSKQPINSTQTNLPKNGPPTTINGNLTSRRIYDDYDINDLQLDKYKIMVAPNKYKTINASNVRFLNRNPGSVNNPGGSGTGIKQFEIKVSGKYVVLPNGTLFSGLNGAKSFNHPGSVPESRASINSNNSVTPIPWVISPACLQQNESKYIFSAIFNKKPTVHLLTADNGTTPNHQTPKIVINQNSVTMSAGNATPTNNNYVRISPPDTTKHQVLTKTPNSVVIITTNNSTTPVKNPKTGQLKSDETLLTDFTIEIQNNTKPQNHATPSKPANTITTSGGINTNGSDKKPKPPLLTTAQQTQQQTGQLISHIQANVPVKIPTVTITTQGTKKIEPIPLFLLENTLRQTPIPEIPFNRTMTTALKKSQQAINNILNSEIGERSFFPPELDQNFKRPTEKKTVGDLITQKDTEVQSPDILYELFKNITMTNVINEDLNRKLLDESQIHTQQNWQLIRDNSDILNVLKNKNE